MKNITYLVIMAICSAIIIFVVLDYYDNPNQLPNDWEIDVQ